MPKVGMEPIRRRQLIDATIASISAHGFADTTIATISKAAGVSSGIIHHYFGGKNELLEATMRSLLRQLRAEVVARLHTAQTPEQRLAAIIEGNFSADQFEMQVVNSWLAFWAQVPHVPELARLQRMNSARLQSNLRHALRQLLPADEAERAAFGLAALIEGLWLRCALNGGIDPALAATAAHDYVSRLLGAPDPLEKNTP